MPLGAILGDFIGAPYEKHNLTRTDFPWPPPRSRFTDDTVLTLATCRALIHDVPYREVYRQAVREHPGVGYGPNFQRWAMGPEHLGAPNSAGNGAAMRVSPIAWAFDDLAVVMDHAERSALSTHNHPDAVAGAQAMAGGVWTLRRGGTIEAACALAETKNFSLQRTIADWRPRPWSAWVQSTVPVAFAALREGHDFESTVRLAVSAGGDSDTIASMAGALAEAKWGIPDHLAAPALDVLRRGAPSLYATLDAFRQRYGQAP